MNRSYSLKKNREFRFVYRTGKSYGGRAAVLIVTRARHRSYRVGFSVSKKVGNAVTRNLVKRRMREAYTKLMPNIKPGYSLVFVAREAAANYSYQTILESMEKLIKKAKICNDALGEHQRLSPMSSNAQRKGDG